MNLLIENYFTKLDEIKTTCTNTLTTKTELETLINELTTIETTLTNLFSLESTIPNEFNTLLKIIIYEIEKNDKKLLQSSLYDFIRLRDLYPSNLTSNEDIISYKTETTTIKNYINTIFNNDEAIRYRINITKRC